MTTGHSFGGSATRSANIEMFATNVERNSSGRDSAADMVANRLTPSLDWIPSRMWPVALSTSRSRNWLVPQSQLRKQFVIQFKAFIPGKIRLRPLCFQGKSRAR
jgi:hypothetical protein